MEPSNPGTSVGAVESRSVARALTDARQERGRIALLPFIPAGYPDLATTAALLPALERAGATAVEIGFPFSDPIADGPTIQAAFNEALSKKVRVADVLRTVREARASVGIPLLAMVSYSLVYRQGPARFFADARASGFDGVILPDVPLPEAEGVCDLARSAGLETVLLVAPTTPPERRAAIARQCSGFVYYLSVSGITGARDQLPADLEANVRQLKGVSPAPVCVGFGISRPEHVKQLAGVADGAIVGSAVVKRIDEARRADAAVAPSRIADAVAAYCRELLSLVR